MLSAVLRFLPFNVRAHKSSACNAWTAAALRLIWRMLSSRITLAAFVLFIPRCHCLTFDGNVRFNYLSFFYPWDIVCMRDMCLRCLFKLSLCHWYKSCFFLYFNTSYFGNYCYMLFLYCKKLQPFFSETEEGSLQWLWFFIFFCTALQIPLSPSLAKQLAFA